MRPSSPSSLRSALFWRTAIFPSPPRLFCSGAKPQPTTTSISRPFSLGSTPAVRLRLQRPPVRARELFPGLSPLNCVPRSVWTKQRCLSTSPILLQAGSEKPSPTPTATQPTPIEPESEAFGLSEKATKAAQVNLSARLHKDGNPNTTKLGLDEVARLLRIARPEAKWLGGSEISGCLILELVNTNHSHSCFRSPPGGLGHHNVYPVRPL